MLIKEGKGEIDLQIIQLEDELSCIFVAVDEKRKLLDQLKMLHLKMSVDQFPSLNAA